MSSLLEREWPCLQIIETVFGVRVTDSDEARNESPNDDKPMISCVKKILCSWENLGDVPVDYDFVSEEVCLELTHTILAGLNAKGKNQFPLDYLTNRFLGAIRVADEYRLSTSRKACLINPICTISIFM